MRKECADCGNERIMVCPSCNQSDAAELRQLRSEVPLLREVAEAARVFVRSDGRDDPPALYAKLKAALKALEAARA